MGRLVLIDALSAAVLLSLWYFLFARYNREKGARALRWVEAACTAKGTSYEGPTAGEYPRAYLIRDPVNVPHVSYRLVLSFNANLGQYYGVQGTAWKNPPLLNNPTQTETVNGKQLLLYFNGHKITIVAWKTPQAVYWISNTLTDTISNSQMVGIAGSLTRG